MKLHLTRLGAASSEWLEIQSFSVVSHPEYYSKWVRVKHINGEEELICPVMNMHYCYVNQ
jgi:hypothetical protein